MLFTQKGSGNLLLIILVVAVISLGLTVLLLSPKSLSLSSDNFTSLPSPNTGELSQDKKTSRVELIGEKNNNLLGGGVSVKYPKGYHVATFTEYEESRTYVLISENPFWVNTPHGPNSDFIISHKNGSKTPVEDFEKEMSEFKSFLTDVKQETLSSKYYDTIYHIQGTASDIPGGNHQEKYYLRLTDPEKMASDALNQGYVIATLNTSAPHKAALLKEIVMQIKECHRTTCENE